MKRGSITTNQRLNSKVVTGSESMSRGVRNISREY